MQDKAIVVTGAASGLGLATAHALAAQGHRVAMVDLARPDPIPDGCKAFYCDVTDAKAVSATLHTIGKTMGGMSALVCCAGIAPGSKLVGRDGPHDPELFAKVMAVNVQGTFNMMASAAAAMKDNTPDDRGQRGVLITTASIAAFEGQIGQIAYAASKGAVAAMTLPAARELARDGIRAVSIAPGVFDTPMMQGMPDEVRDAIAATVPFPPKLCDPKDFAALVLHILTNPSINGEVIRIDGALRMAAK